MKATICGLLLFPLVFMFLVPVTVRAVDDSVIEVIVEQNDNLIILCKKYLEDPNKWPEISRINKLDDSNYISPGQRLIIPVRLLKSVPVDGRVVFVKGDVTVQTGEKTSWKSVQLNDVVRRGDLIKTGHESAVEIAFNDETTFSLASDTVLELTLSQQVGKASIWHRFLLSMGRMLMKIRKATGNEPRIEIQTPAAAFLARGTEFRVSIDMQEASNSEVLQGIVEAEAVGQAVMIREGEGTRVNKGEPPLQPRKLLPPPAFRDIQPLYSRIPFTLTVSPIEGAVAYRILLSTDEDGRDVVREKVIKNGEPMEVAGLGNGAYYLQCRSIDDLGLEGASLASQKITVEVKPHRYPVADAIFIMGTIGMILLILL